MSEADEAIQDKDWAKWFNVSCRNGKVSDEQITAGIKFAALYNHARAVGMGFIHFIDEVMSAEEGCYVVCNRDYVDYFRGRVMKVDTKKFDLYLYDRDNGSGQAAIDCKGCTRCKR